MLKELLDKPQTDVNLVVAANAMNEAYHSLDKDTSRRLERYELYDRFFNGDQWYRIRDFKGHKYVSNLCHPTVLKYSALLMSEFPKIHAPRESETEIKYDAPYLGKELTEGLSTPEEFNRSDAKEKILRKVLFEDNSEQVYKEGATAGSLYGDTIFYTYWGKDKKVHIENIAPVYFRAKFKTNNYKDCEYAFVNKIMHLNEIKAKYDGFQAIPDGPDQYTTVWDQEYLLAEGEYAVVKEYWDDTYHAVLINNRFAQKPKKHGMPGLPFTVIPNMWKPFRPWGISDLHDVIEIQEEYNIAVSDEAKIVKLFSNPKAIGTNITPKDADVIKRAAEEGFVLPLRKDASLFPFEFKGNIYPIQQRINDILNRYYMVSGLVPVFWGSVQGSIVTGVAMTAQASPTLQVINVKLGIWGDALKQMLQYIMKLLEDKGGTEEESGLTYKEIFDSNYSIKLIPVNRMPRDDSIYIMNELNKMNAGVQSRTTTMTNLGIESPDDELAMISYERLNPLISPDEALKREEAEARIAGAQGRAGRPAGPAPTLQGVNLPPGAASPAAQPGVAGGSQATPAQQPGQPIR